MNSRMGVGELRVAILTECIAGVTAGFIAVWVTAVATDETVSHSQLRWGIVAMMFALVSWDSVFAFGRLGWTFLTVREPVRETLTPTHSLVGFIGRHLLVAAILMAVAAGIWNESLPTCARPQSEELRHFGGVMVLCLVPAKIWQATHGVLLLRRSGER